MQRFIAAQVSNNQTTRDCRDTYASHRAIVMALIERLRRDGNSTIAILGAGNCNDLDLASLADNFRAVHLIDLDREALSHGLRSQATTGDTRLHCHAPADITDPEFTLDPPVDVVVSCCVFSQIVDAAANDGLPAAALNDRVLDLRRRHFELLLHSVPEAGTALSTATESGSRSAPGDHRAQLFHWTESSCDRGHAPPGA